MIKVMKNMEGGRVNNILILSNRTDLLYLSLLVQLFVFMILTDFLLCIAIQNFDQTNIDFIFFYQVF